MIEWLQANENWVILGSIVFTIQAMLAGGEWTRASKKQKALLILFLGPAGWVFWGVLFPIIYFFMFLSWFYEECR